MTEIVNPYKDHPYYITNGQPKIGILQSFGISFLAYPGLLNAVRIAEQEFDKKNGVGLVTPLDNYPYKVVVAKSEAGKRWLGQLLDRKLDALQLPFGKDTSFVVSDTTWRVDGGYVNKPISYPNGAINGVRELKSMLLSLRDNQVVMGSETWVAKFWLTGKGSQFFRFQTSIGIINPDLTEEQLHEMTRMIFKNREIMAAGLDVWECLQKGIIVPNRFISLCLTMFERETINHNGIFLSRNLNSQQLDEETTNFLKGWWLGIISPDYEMSHIISYDTV